MVQGEPTNKGNLDRDGGPATSPVIKSTKICRGRRITFAK